MGKLFSGFPSGRFLESVFGADSPFGREETPLYGSTDEELVEAAPTLNLEPVSFGDGGVVDGTQFFSKRAPREARRSLKNATVNQLASLIWLKTLLMTMKENGVFDMDVIKDGFDDGKSSSERFSNQMLKMGEDIFNAASKFGTAGATATAVGVSGPFALIAAAFVFLATVIGKLAEGDIRYAQSVAISDALKEFVKTFGYPPMGLLHAAATIDPYPNYTPVLGGGSYLRFDEWGPGVIISYMRLYKYLLDNKWDMDNVPVAAPQFRTIAMRAGASVVNNNVQGLGGSFGTALQYAFHPRFMLQTPVIPAGRTTRQAKAKLYWNTDNPYPLYVKVLQREERMASDPFQFSKDDCEMWMRQGGVDLGRFKGFNQPATLIFQVGHDPGSNRIPTALSNALPGNYGSIQIPKSQWARNVDLNTNGRWWIT